MAGRINTPYWEKLRDPRWQRRRLEVMQAAEFRCVDCESDDKTLNVHHKLYRKGANPWDYADHELECLCEPCHELKHALVEQLNQLIAQGVDLERVLGYAKGLRLFHAEFCPEDPYPEMTVASYEEAMGIAAAWDVEVENIIELTENGNVSFDQLHSCRQARRQALLNSSWSPRWSRIKEAEGG